MDACENFIRNVNNLEQKHNLNKLNTFNSVYEKYNLYLIDADQCFNDEFNFFLNIKILGGENVENKREVYNIKIPLYDWDYNITCSCKAFTYRKKYKHLLFLVIIVCKIYDYKFLDTFKLSNEQINSMVKTLDIDNNFIWDNSKLSIKNINNLYKKSTKEFCKDDLCIICCDTFNLKKTTVSCPCCDNYIHISCVNRWLQYNDTCIYCRSQCWINYNIINPSRAEALVRYTHTNI